MSKAKQSNRHGVMQVKQQLQTPKVAAGGVQKRVSSSRPSSAHADSPMLIKAVSIPCSTPQTRSKAALAPDYAPAPAATPGVAAEQDPALEAALAAFAGLSLRTPLADGSGMADRPVTRSQTKACQPRARGLLSPRGLPLTPKAMPKSPHGKAAGSAKKGRLMAFLTGVKKPGIAR